MRARLGDDGRPGLRRRLRRLWLVPPAIVAGSSYARALGRVHPRRPLGERHVPALAATYGDRLGWQWAQYVSGVLGLALLALWLRRWWVRTEPASGHQPRGAGWPWAVIAMAGTGGAAGAAPPTGAPPRMPPAPPPPPAGTPPPPG